MGFNLYTALLLLTCVIPCLALLADQKKSKEEDPEPGTKITETLKGNFDQQLVIDHRKYGGSGEAAATERVDDDVDYSYPDNVQLVPNVPVSPQTPKYTLVPVKRITTTTTSADSSSSQQDYDDVHDADLTPTIPYDFQQEIANFRIPHVGLPGYITDPPPIADEGDEVDDTEDGEEDEEPNHDHLFTDDFLEPDEFKDEAQTSSEVLSNNQDDDSQELKYAIRQIPNPLVPVVVATASPIEFNNQEPEEYRQIHSTIQHQRQQFHSHSPGSLHHFAPPPPPPIPAPHQVRHYGLPRPVPMFRVRATYPAYRPQVHRVPHQVYVRYPRHQRPIYHQHPRPPAPHPYNRVRVMTQNYVQHPNVVSLPRPVMLMSNAELRANKTPRKKKKKAKGACKPKKIIKEIHFHHYDPQLSAQLAPLEGINLKDAEDYENNIKVITKETDVEEDTKKGHKDYHRYNENMEAEMDRHKEETEHRLNQPDYYPDDYNPHYSETASGSKEYIDYNIQTDSQSAIHEPHPSHDYPTDRAFRAGGGGGSNTTATIQPFSIQPGRYVKHKSVRYDIKTPGKSKNSQR